MKMFKMKNIRVRFFIFATVMMIFFGYAFGEASHQGGGNTLQGGATTYQGADFTHQSSTAKLSQGEKLFKENKAKEAAQVLENEILNGQISANTYNFLGLSYYQLGEYGKSVDAFDRGIKAQPTNTKILAFNKGNSYYAMKDYTSAVSAYSQSLADDENFYDALLNRANSLLMANQLKNAKSDYEKFVEKCPQDQQKGKIEALIKALTDELARREEEARLLAEQNKAKWEKIDPSISENQVVDNTVWELVDDLMENGESVAEDDGEKKIKEDWQKFDAAIVETEQPKKKDWQKIDAKIDSKIEENQKESVDSWQKVEAAISETDDEKASDEEIVEVQAEKILDENPGFVGADDLEGESDNGEENPDGDASDEGMNNIPDVFDEEPTENVYDSVEENTDSGENENLGEDASSDEAPLSEDLSDESQQIEEIVDDLLPLEDLENPDWENSDDGKIEVEVSPAENWENLSDDDAMEIKRVERESQEEYKKWQEEQTLIRQEREAEKIKKSQEKNGYDDENPPASREEILQELKEAEEARKKKLLDDVANSLQNSDSTNMTSGADDLIEYDQEGRLD